TPDDFVGEAMGLALVGALGAWVVTILAGGAVWNVVPAIAAGAVVFQMPASTLKGKADRRVGDVTRRLPYSLEAVVLATDSGAAFEEALEILVHEDPRNPLHEEFDQVLRDTQLGLKRREALHQMSARVGTQDVISLVMALDIADDLGTPIADTLSK